jgi:excisionase family DNA binding protein
MSAHELTKYSRHSEPPTVPLDAANLPAFLTVDEVATLLRVCRKTVYEAIQRGEIKATKVGKALRIRRDALQK